MGSERTETEDILGDVRAIQQRVRDHFDGSSLKLIQFLDQHHAMATKQTSTAE